MKKLIPINPVIFYIFIISIVAVGEAYAISSSLLPSVPDAVDSHIIRKQEQEGNSRIEKHIPDAEIVTDADSIEFDVEVVQPRKFFLSFTKKREETFFIKIYDIIGNLIHHEVVSKKDKFRKHYDLSKYKADLYVIEVSSGKKAKIKRLFLG